MKYKLLQIGTTCPSKNITIAVKTKFKAKDFQNVAQNEARYRRSLAKAPRATRLDCTVQKSMIKNSLKSILKEKKKLGPWLQSMC